MDSLFLMSALLMLVVAFFVGDWIERRHYKSIRARETRWAGLPVVTLRTLPPLPGWTHDRSGLVSGHVVISVDYFKRFLAGLRGIFGGRVRSYESLMDRARREAVLRLKEQALHEGYQAVVNVRLETTTLARSSKNNKKTAGVEILAFGTGIRMAKAAA
ncbi:MAG: YbjQ family protein [bacterium]|nr:YbjQ family protein [bacterium]